jgi:hypothetical protein
MYTPEAKEEKGGEYDASMEGEMKKLEQMETQARNIKLYINQKRREEREYVKDLNDLGKWFESNKEQLQINKEASLPNLTRLKKLQKIQSLPRRKRRQNVDIDELEDDLQDDLQGQGFYDDERNDIYKMRERHS